MTFEVSADALASAKERIRGSVRERMRPIIRPDSRFTYQLEHISPDFPGSENFPGLLQKLPFYEGENPVYITPDNCTDHVRAQLIREQRPLMAIVHIALGYHYFAPGSVPKGQEQFAGTHDGSLIFGENVDLEFLMNLPRPDFYVTGAAVMNRDGARWGKGHGYGDVQWGIFYEAGLVDQSTPVVVCTHDYVIVDEEIPTSPRDLTADWIVTPTEIIEVARPPPKPTVGIDYEALDAEFAKELALPLAQLEAMKAKRASTE